MALSGIRATWAGEQRFDVGRPGGPVAHLDGKGVVGPGYVDTMLSALAGCFGVDVVEILAKRRTPVERLTIDVTGLRIDETPRRVVRIEIQVSIEGKGIERSQAERAIDLSLSKYCSVRSSLDPAIPISFTLTLNGAAGPSIAVGSIALNSQAAAKD